MLVMMVVMMIPLINHPFSVFSLILMITKLISVIIDLAGTKNIEKIVNIRKRKKIHQIDLVLHCFDSNLTIFLK